VYFQLPFTAKIVHFFQTAYSFRWVLSTETKYHLFTAWLIIVEWGLDYLKAKILLGEFQIWLCTWVNSPTPICTPFPLFYAAFSQLWSMSETFPWRFRECSVWPGTRLVNISLRILSSISIFLKTIVKENHISNPVWDSNWCVQRCTVWQKDPCLIAQWHVLFPVRNS